MLTGKLVRVRYARNRILPCYLDAGDDGWRETAQRLLELFRAHEGRSRGELEREIQETFGDLPGQQVCQGLAKLLYDRCDFEVVASQPPAMLRELVFAAAAAQRLAQKATGRAREQDATGQPRSFAAFDRDAVLRGAAAGVGLTPAELEQGLFADLKCAQKLVHFKNLTAERLLQRYNVALAQAVLLRSIGMKVIVRGESSSRYRQLLRQVKFHRLVCEVEPVGPAAWCLKLDGPLSLFLATQKYGLQLALFLPAVLQCRDFDLDAELRWGPQRKPRRFTLGPGDGLVSDHHDAASHVPADLRLFVELFRKKVPNWHISEVTDLVPLGETYWAPDYQLTHAASGRLVYLEVLGFWRRATVQHHLERLRAHATVPFVLAVSEQLRVEEAELEGLPAGVHRFRQMPLPDEVVRLAEEASGAA